MRKLDMNAASGGTLLTTGPIAELLGCSRRIAENQIIASGPLGGYTRNRKGGEGWVKVPLKVPWGLKRHRDYPPTGFPGWYEVRLDEGWVFQRDDSGKPIFAPGAIEAWAPGPPPGEWIKRLGWRRVCQPQLWRKSAGRPLARAGRVKTGPT